MKAVHNRSLVPNFFGCCCGDSADVAPRYPQPQQQTPPLRQPSPPPLREISQELAAALQYYPPVATKTGVNGSFFLCNTRGERAAIFKPMNMEAGGPKNHRLDQAHNVQFRNSIKPGQGAGNEVLAYELDKLAFGHHYGIPHTILIKLNHQAFEGEEFGSAQAFISSTRSLADMTLQERDQIPQSEWMKLNFRLISGSTDAHLGNILYCSQTKKIHLIDSGDDFVGASGQCQYYNPWTVEPWCKMPMSEQEAQFLAHLDCKQVMGVFEQCALKNEQMHPLLRISGDKYMTQLLRLELARVAGHYRLSQAEWSSLMCPFKDQYGRIYASMLEQLYTQHVIPHIKTGSTWRDVACQVNWAEVNSIMQNAAHRCVHGRR